VIASGSAPRRRPSPPRAWEDADARDARLGDVVRRRGRGLRVGIVLASDKDDLLVRWASWHSPAQATWHPCSDLERRVDAAEIGGR
jgi:hypothetical protein